MNYNFSELRYRLNQNFDYSKKENLERIVLDIKNWAKKYNCKFFAHFFMPLTSNIGVKYTLIEELNSENLLCEEVDASSFEVDNLAKCESAKGYCILDRKGSLYIIDDVLYIPSLFKSHNNYKLDYKTNLYRVIKLIKEKSKHLFDLMHIDNTYIYPHLGLEQEFFLLDLDKFNSREDLIYLNKTLFGDNDMLINASNRHYFSIFSEKIKMFFNEVNMYLNSLGLKVKSEHKEVSNNQYEIALEYNKLDVALEENLILRLILEKVAFKHDLKCIFEEKPFLKVNGSGKHNNFSLITNNNLNVFDLENKEYSYLKKLFISIFISSINKHRNDLECFVLDEHNLDRLGGFEAPPSIISIYLPNLVKDYYLKDCTSNSERNRTSPIAFCNNKFEIRGIGSSSTGYEFNTYLLLILLETIEKLNIKLEKEKRKIDRNYISKLAYNMYIKAKPIIYNKSCYNSEYLKYLKKHKINMKTYCESLKYYENRKYIKLCKKYDLLSRKELKAILNIKFKNYVKFNLLKVNVLLNMARDIFIPFFNKEMVNNKVLFDLKKQLENEMEQLESLFNEINNMEGLKEKAKFIEDNLINNLIKATNLLTMIEKKLPQNEINYKKSINILINL